MLERVKLDNGWVVELEESAYSTDYTIKQIFARFGHGVYLALDTSGFTQEIWDLFHERIEEARK